MPPKLSCGLDSRAPVLTAPDVPEPIGARPEVPWRSGGSVERAWRRRLCHEILGAESAAGGMNRA